MKEIKQEDLLLKIYEEQKKMKEEILPKIYEEQKKMKEEILLKIYEKLLAKIDENKKEIAGVKEELKEVKEDVRNISRTVAKIEVEHGEKLQALFDGFQAQDQKKEELKKRIKICEKKIDKQGDKIYYLNSIVNKK